jgi:hypothetical protein
MHTVRCSQLLCHLLDVMLQHRVMLLPLQLHTCTHNLPEPNA